jgi:hypothetical protein
MLIKLDDQQLGWMAADRARVLASGGGDPLAVGEAARNLAVLARKAGWHQQASSIALSAAASPLLAGAGARLAAERGLLVQSAAYTAARAGDRDGMRELTDEVASIAAQLGGRALLRDHGGGFSPATVELHRVSAENYAGDPGAAVAAALRIVPASLPTTERRARYWTDTARAYANWGRREDCVSALLSAEREAPEETHAARRCVTWFQACWSPGGPGRNCAAWPPGAALPDQLGLPAESRGTEHPGEAARAVPGVQPCFQRGEVAADHGGDDLAVGVGGTGVELTQERTVSEGDRVGEPAQGPGVGAVRQERGLVAVGGDGAREVGEGQARHARPGVRAGDPAGLRGLPGDGGGLGVGGPFHHDAQVAGGAAGGPGARVAGRTTETAAAGRRAAQSCPRA